MNMKSKTKTVDREKIVKFLDEELRINKITDLSRNGLQVQGTEKICRIGLAVDACLEAYEAGAERSCQMIIAHHGLIWGGLPYITKSVYRQVKYLFDSGINLYAAHLPLDLHPVYGNNAQLADIVGLKSRIPFGDYKGTMVGCMGVLPAAKTTAALSARLEKALGSRNVLLPFGKREIRRVAVLSGRGTDMLAEAIDKGADCFITGEPHHEHHHLAKEAGINAIYCGHYYSEKVGVLAIGKLLEKKFGVSCEFLDIPTIM
jgi:dinuclear metal center YbgI/SA1388 family protein